MRTKEALAQTAQRLAPMSFDSAHLEAEMLLMYLLGLSRAQLYLRLEEELEEGVGQGLLPLVQRRLQGEALAYILGRVEFFGRDFLVDHRVLIPRADTELLVEKALELIQSRYVAHRLPCRVADIGTGSGAIAISLAAHAPGCTVYATDISPAALELAAHNCRLHGVQGRITLLHGDMLAPLPEPVDLLVGNLPYVSDLDLIPLMQDGTAEVWLGAPVVALSGGEDGLDKIRQLLKEASPKVRDGGSILLEIGWDHGTAAYDLALAHFPRARVSLSRDLAGVDRMVWIDMA